MERYSEKQLEIFRNFYESCRKRGIDPTGNEADKQRALLLAKENADLVQIFGEKLDGGHVEAYRMGQQYTEKKAAEAKKAADDAIIAEQRKIDEQAAAFEKKLSELRGRDKRLFFLQIGVDEAQRQWNAAYQHSLNVTAQASKAMESLSKGQDSWGTLGGIAAGITGSTAVGAAVAADAMARDNAVRAENAAGKEQVKQWSASSMNAYIDTEYLLKRKIGAIQTQIDKVKLHLTDERPVEELMSHILFDKPQATFTKGNTMVLKIGIQYTNDTKIAGEVNAVLDGCFVAEVYEGERKVGEAYLNCPRDGIERHGILMGHCLEAKPGKTYSILIMPLALWLIEKYIPPVITYTGKVDGRYQDLSYQVCDLNDFVPAYKETYQWSELSVRDMTWQERLEQMRQEAERKAEATRKAEEERKAAAAVRAKKNKKIAMIAAPIAVVAIIAGVLISNSAQKNSAYQEAVALMESGEYDAAVAAFEELGDYQDSAEQINNTRYNQAFALVDEGNYDDAISIFTELGDYKDSAEQIQNTKYIQANTLLNDGNYEDAVALFTELGDYKDSAEQASSVKSMVNNEKLYDEAMTLFQADKGILQSDLSTVLTLLQQVSPDYQDTSMLIESLPRIMEAIKSVDGVYEKEGYREVSVINSTTSIYATFKVSGDKWEYSDRRVRNDGYTETENQDGAIRWIISITDRNISLNCRVEGLDVSDTYFGIPDIVVDENGNFTFESDGWTKQ